MQYGDKDTHSLTISICILSFPSDAIGSQLNPSGGRLNKKDGLTRYGDSHVKDKTS